MCLVQQHCAAHGVAEGEPWFGRERSKDLVLDGREIALIGVEMGDMATPPPRDLAIGLPLSPPIHDDDIETPVEQVADDLEIFFDEFAAAHGDQDRATAVAARDPAGDTEREAIRGPCRGDNGARRDRVSGRLEKVHPELPFVGVRRRPTNQRSGQIFCGKAVPRVLQRLCAKPIIFSARALGARTRKRVPALWRRFLFMSLHQGGCVHASARSIAALPLHGRFRPALHDARSGIRVRRRGRLPAL